jgi:hypothetical protein
MGDVGVEYGGTGDEDRTAWRKLQDEFAVPQNEMPTLRIVVVPKGGDCTPAKGEIGEVAVAKGTCTGSEIEGTGREDAVEEGPFQVLVPLVEHTHIVDVKVKEIWRPIGKES